MARRHDNTVEMIMLAGGVGFLAWKLWPSIKASSLGKMLTGNSQPSGSAVVIGPGSTIKAPGAPVVGSNTNLPLGIRNNNPGNIRYNLLNQWTGQIGSEKGYAKFSDPVYGYRAMFKLLKTYYNNYGLKNLLDVGQRWAPTADGNNPVAWSSNVALMAGIPQQTPFNINDKTTMIKIARGITGAENGSAFTQHFKDDVLSSAWAMA